MRLCQIHETVELGTLYDEAAAHAANVGYIDWQSPFPRDVLEGYIDAEQLYRFDEVDVGLAAAIRISTGADERIWQSVEDEALYLSKVVTADSVRGSNYLGRVVFPAVMDLASSLQIELLRFDSLANNQGLTRLYSRIGAVTAGNRVFTSSLTGRPVEVTRWQLLTNRVNRPLST